MYKGPMADLRTAWCRAVLCLVLLAGVFPGAQAQTRNKAAPNVVASIKPVHALVAGVMAGVGQPALIVEGAGSPHDFSLKPSKARVLEDADIIFWIGPELEIFLQKPIQALAARARIVPLSQGPTTTGGHSFLDPRIAGEMVIRIGRSLSRSDPANSVAYTANAAAVSASIEALIDEVNAILAPVKSIPFFVFHDAYGAFTGAFDLNVAGAITMNPQIRPGAGRLTEIRSRLKGQEGICVFAEPQFNPNLVALVTEGSSARTGTLDPLGASLQPGPDLYLTLIRNMATAIARCLSGVN